MQAPTAAELALQQHLNQNDAFQKPLSFAGRPDADRTITGDFLARLLSGYAARTPLRDPTEQAVHERRVWQIHFQNAIIDGEVNLENIGSSGTALPHFVVENCTFRGDLKLDGAVLASFAARQCIFESNNFRAKGILIREEFLLRNCTFTKHANICLDECRIERTCRIIDCVYLGIGGFQSISIHGGRVSGDVVLRDVRICNQNGRAVDLRGLSVGGSLHFSSKTSGTNIEGMVDMFRTIISGDVSFAGTTILGDKWGKSVNLEGSQINGYLTFDPLKGENDRFSSRTPVFASYIEGTVHLLGARVGLQALFRKTTIITTRDSYGNCGNRHGPTAILADTVEVGSGFMLTECLLHGAITLQQATLKGQLSLRGCRVLVGMSEIRAIAASGVNIEGKLLLIAQNGCTEIEGTIDLCGAVIEGNFQIASTSVAHRQSDYSIIADDITIKGDLLFQRSDLTFLRPQLQDPQICKLSGTVRLPGAKITGRVHIVGAEFRGHKWESAIFASGSSIGGGIICEPYAQQGKSDVPSEIIGGLRLNGAELGSSCRFIHTIITSTPGGAELALQGTNTSFKNQVEFDGCTVQGEIRLYGTDIQNMLLMRGGHYTAGSTGFCIDAYNSDIRQGVVLGEDIRLTGIVGFACSRIGNAEFGDYGASVSVRKPSRLAAPQVFPKGMTLHGSFRLSGAQIRYSTSFCEVTVIPPIVFRKFGLGQEKVADAIDASLKRFGLDDPCTSIDASHADLGQNLHVRLNPSSSGRVYMDSARVLSVKDHVPENYDFDFYERKLGNGWGKSPSLQGWNPDMNDYGDFSGVLLSLTGFCYRSLQDDPQIGRFQKRNPGDSQWKTFKFWIKWGFTYSPRITWLDRQHPDCYWERADGFIPGPFLQLSKVLREEGRLREANSTVRERRRRQLLASTSRPWDRFLGRIFAYLSGFGYSTIRVSSALGLVVIMSCALGWFSGPVEILGFPFRESATKRVIAKAVGGQEIISRCDHPFNYAWNNVIPGLKLDVGNGCEVVRPLTRGDRIFYFLYELNDVVAWFVLPLTALTFSGLLKETSDK